MRMHSRVDIAYLISYKAPFSRSARAIGSPLPSSLSDANEMYPRDQPVPTYSLQDRIILVRRRKPTSRTTSQHDSLQ